MVVAHIGSYLCSQGHTALCLPVQPAIWDQVLQLAPWFSQQGASNGGMHIKMDLMQMRMQTKPL
jgi:hypothetical protein